MNFRSCSFFIVAAVVTGAGCQHSELYCDDHSDCSGERPFCDINGETEASEGIRKTCVAAPIQKLKVVLDGTKGSVVSTPAGIDCGTTCIGEFKWDAEVSLAAIPDNGADFDGWSGACEGTGPCRFKIDQDTSVTASFSATGFPLLASTSGSGKITSEPAGIDCGADCTETFENGTVVTLTAVPFGASKIGGWSGACAGLTNTCTVTMNAATSVGVSFDLNQVSLNVSFQGTGGGRITSDVGDIDCPGTCSDSYAIGTTVTLQPVADATSTFAGWSGACSGTGNCEVTLNSAQSVTATFNSVTTYALNVTKSGTGDGTVTSHPAGIDCGATCFADFQSGTEVTLTATPSADSTVAGWSIQACSGNTCDVTLSSAQSVSVTFTEVTHSLSVTKSGTGTGEVTSMPAGIDCGSDCSEDYAQGTMVTLTAVPTNNATFGGWSGACSGMSKTCSVTMDSARAVSAAFDLGQLSLSVSLQGNGSGSVTSDVGSINCPGTCSDSYTIGAEVRLSASASSGSVFTGWSGGCTGSGFCDVNMSTAQSVTATFTPLYLLTVTKTGSGNGTVQSQPVGISCGATCSAEFTEGTPVTLTQTPDATSTFAGWSGGGCSGTGSCVTTVSGVQTVTAQFTEITYELTVNKSGAGEGTVTSKPAGIDCGSTCSADFGVGTTVTLTASPSPFSRFDGWSGCSGGGTCTITVSSATSVAASFSRSPGVVFKRGLYPRFELFRAGFDGADLARLSGSMTPGGGIQSTGQTAVSPNNLYAAYIADQDSNDVFELYTVRMDGTGVAKISGTMVSGGNVVSFQWSPDGSRIAYLADQDTDGVDELYSALPDGTGRVTLSGSIVSGGYVDAYEWAPDGSRVAYVAEQDTDDVRELYTVFPAGAGRTKVSSTMVIGGDVVREQFGFPGFLWAPDSSRIAYVADQDTDGVQELYTVEPTGLSNLKVSGPIIGTPSTNRGVKTYYYIFSTAPAWAPDGSRIAYVADLAANGQYEVYTVPPTSRANNTRVSGSLVQNDIAVLPERAPWAPDSSRIVYNVILDSSGAWEIYTVGPTGAGNVRVSGSLVSGGSTAPDSPIWSPDSTKIAYRADQDTDEVFELYTVSPTGLSNVKVSGGGEVGNLTWAWAPNSDYLSYIAMDGLYIVRPDGADNTKVSGNMIAGGGVRECLWGPDSLLLLYLADQDVFGTLELYSSNLTGSTNIKVSGILSSGHSVDSLIIFGD